jgi:hypothetical protein
MLYNGYMGAHAAKSILKSLEKSINPKPRFKEQVKSNIAEEREKFLEKIEKAIDSCTDINTTTNADLQTRVKEKLQSLSLQDFEDALAELIENKQATFVTLEKKPYENDIKSGLEKVFTETKNQTITLSPNDKGNGFGQNFLIMKKSKTQTQDSMYDVATNIVCAHAFNMFFGVNMNKDTITMPFIDVYHLIVGIKTYSTEKDFTFLEEIYIPKKTIIKKTLSS